jgi:hypothetical protein
MERFLGVILAGRKQKDDIVATELMSHLDVNNDQIRKTQLCLV